MSALDKVQIQVLRPAWLLALLLLATGSTPLAAQPGATGAAGATVRERMAARGVEVGAGYVNDVFLGASSGLAGRGAHLHALDVTLGLDLGALAGWRGGTVFVDGLGTYGGSPSGFAGDLQALSSIDAPDGWRLYEAYLDQAFYDGRLSLRAGLYDLNTEFYVAETAALFLNGAHGIGPELGLSGHNGPSIFPYTAAALRLRYMPDNGAPGEGGYVQAVVLDGVPCGEGEAHLLPVRLRRDEGALIVGEAGFRGAGGARAYALGAWTYTARFDALYAPGGAGRAASFGAYGFAEHTLLRHPGRRLDAYARAGFARARVNAVSFAWGGGLVYSGLAGAEDCLGLAVSAVHFGRPFHRAARRDGAPAPAPEVAFELTYRLPLGGWLVLQPDLQLVVHPGGAAAPPALVFGQRIEIVL